MRILAGAISLALLAGGLVACGGSVSDSDSGTNGSQASETSPQGADSGSTGGGNSQEAGKRSSAETTSDVGLKTGSDGDSSSPGATADGPYEKKARFKKFKAAPLRVSGGGSEQFVTKGGDNSIQEFGEEASDELAEAAEALHTYYVAFSNDDWATTCSYLSKSLRESYEHFGSQGKDGATMSCPEFSANLFANRSSEVRREQTIVNAVSLRRDGDQAFLIYHGAEYDTGGSYGPSDLYAMSMKQEDGGWKMGLAIGTQLGIPKNLPKSLEP